MTTPDPDADRRSASEPTPESAAGPEGIPCDFCGEVVASVRRIALDGDYDRLRKPHQERYACPACSQKKEDDRIGQTNGPSDG